MTKQEIEILRHSGSNRCSEVWLLFRPAFTPAFPIRAARPDGIESGAATFDQRELR
ncbi:hypothetical protein HFN78_20995 [Rhizobium laguerreae]|uniref:hypothetical protein n=1 Tax=Rhizobium laguerreae TaxID=1076926 RepID=UPI0013F17D70|nr:hypothetical protein [Rhizobium laguerreae]MBY3081064.1 hypothetical protein [Rhizobium laguerreae]MBY3114964.1 hypothetical protein [Rhizobium laguerreae]MBY3279846.1 hypothetical protein [Rhizobium laguerreae]MBY3422469.1 hypothetical protein [Rhizobium laguerreae]MBY3473385.1 hypothetical protein [Rhizobium laguerreae]